MVTSVHGKNITRENCVSTASLWGQEEGPRSWHAMGEEGGTGPSLICTETDGYLPSSSDQKREGRALRKR